jgi:hypothetical protein
MRAPNGIRRPVWLCAAALALGASCDRTTVLTPRVESVEVGAVPAALAVGERTTLTAVARDPSGNPLPDKPVYWLSMDTTIVRVDSTGTVRARRPGAAKIVAGSEDKRREVEIVVPQGPVLPFNTYTPRELSNADDADEWTFEGRTGQLINVFLQGLSNVPAHQFRLRVVGPAGPLDSLAVLGTDTTRRARAIRWMRLPQNGPYRVRVDGVLGGDRGAYQLMVETVNPRPETVPDSIPLNTLTAETLGPGDIDNFTFWGTNGQEISVSFKAEGGTAADALLLWVYAPNGSLLRFIHIHRDYRGFQASGRLPLDQTGRYTVRVEGLTLTAQGPYQFAVFTINKGPEAAKVEAPPDVQLSSESLSPQGDLDEYTYTASTDQEVNVYFLNRDTTRADTMVLRIIAPNGSAAMDTVLSLGGDSGLFGRAISYLGLRAATPYKIQVEGARNTNGPYTYIVRRINLTPEAVSGTYTLGTTVTTDISPVGDVDEFTFRGAIGSILRITFAATSGPGNDVLRLYLRRSNGTEVLVREAARNQNEQVFETILTKTDDYRIRIQGVNSSSDSGFYRFKVELR